MKMVEVMVGSRMWGLERPDSDVDIRVVSALSFQELVDPWNLEVSDGGKIPQGTDRDGDTTIYELRKFCRLAAGGNPTMMEILFAPEECVLFSNWWWGDLDPEWFIDEDRIARAHMGFAQSQRDQIVPMWRERVDKGKRIGKALSSGILTLRSGMEIIKNRRVVYHLPEDVRQFHMDLRMGHRLTEGSEELDVATAEMDEVFLHIPENHETAKQDVIREWLGGIYSALAATEWERGAWTV